MGGTKSPLKRAPDLRIQLFKNGSTRITAGREIDCGPDALKILDTFAQPQTITQALSKLSGHARGRQHWMKLVSELWAMVEAGVLLPEDAVVPRTSTSIAEARMHRRLLNDELRTRAFVDAINDTVRPGDVVVEIGTGTGILAMAAARAGARRVYAIEASDVAAIAEANIARNGLADRVSVVRGWSHQVELRERCDVLVTETIGDDPLAEGILGSCIDAHDRFLQPNARLIPSALKLYAAPLQLSPELTRKWSADSTVLERWQNSYGFELGALEGLVSARPARLLLDSTELAECHLLGTSTMISSLDLTNPPIANKGSETLVMDRAGTLDGWLVDFALEFGTERRLRPASRLAQDCSWRFLCHLFAIPANVRCGERRVIQYAYDALRPGLRFSLPLPHTDTIRMESQ